MLLVGFFGALCWTLLRPPADFVIRVSRGVVRFSGKFPRSRRADVEEFFKREFEGCGAIAISALRIRPRAVRVIVRGSITNGDCQRIRNFFQTICCDQFCAGREGASPAGVFGE